MKDTVKLGMTNWVVERGLSVPILHIQDGAGRRWISLGIRIVRYHNALIILDHGWFPRLSGYRSIQSIADQPYTGPVELFTFLHLISRLLRWGPMEVQICGQSDHEMNSVLVSADPRSELA